MSGSTWWVGLDGWVLQDGSYTDFVVGQRRQFALELSCARHRRLRPAPEAVAESRRWTRRHTTYDITGHLHHAAPASKGPMWVRDPERESYRSVGRTRTWEHDDGYRLRCTLEDDEPTSSMERGGPPSPYGPLP